MSGDLKGFIKAKGLSLPAGFGRRKLAAWLQENGVPCTEYEARLILGATDLTWVENSLDVDDDRAVEDANFEVTDGVPAGWVATGKTQTIVDENGLKSWVRSKPPVQVAPTIPEAELNEFRQKLLSFSYLRDEFRSKPKTGAPVSYVISQSDAQLGKPGTGEALDNWLNGVDMAVVEAERLLDHGLNIEQVISNNGGDPIEGLFNYSNQSYLIELDLISQIDLAIDTRLSALQRMLRLGLPIRDWTYESNHGEASRAGGGKNIATTTADSHDYLISKQVEKLARLTPGMDQVTFVYPEVGEHDQREWFVYEDVSGVGVYATHGHKEHGKGGFQEAKLFNGIQRVGFAYRRRMSNLRVALGAHFHHHYIQHNGDLSLVGLPALEAYKSSGYLLPGGTFAQPGVLSTVIGLGAGNMGFARPMVHAPFQLVA